MTQDEIRQAVAHFVAQRHDWLQAELLAGRWHAAKTFASDIRRAIEDGISACS